MKSPFLAAVAGIAIVAVVGGGTLLGVTAWRQRELVQKCKTLRIGMTKAEIVVVMGAPTSRATSRRGERLVETLAFETPGIVPSLAAQWVLCEIDTSTGRAVRILCDEDFKLQGASG